MTRKERELYCFLEVFTIDPSAWADPESPHLATALAMGFVKVVKPSGYLITEECWKWIEQRSARIIAHCRAGKHEFAHKTERSTVCHCRWCGQCEDVPCGECAALFSDGTTGTPITFPIYPQIYSTITHSKEKGS
jgi:hypothetical protein